MPEAVSTITTTSLGMTLFLGFLLLVLPRRYAIFPMLIGGCYMTLGQALIIGGLHFYLIRILIFFGLVRIFMRGEIYNIQFIAIDKVLIAWLLVSSFLYVVVSGNIGVLNERLGGFYNALGIYFLVRALVQDFSDIVLVVKMLGIIVIPLSVLFVVEYTTGKNPFFVFGGVPEFAGIREGRLRCQGPFRHPILAGTFGATSFPLFVGLWVYGTRHRLLVPRLRLLATGAILSATIIVVTSSSSGPLLAYVTSIVGLMCWYFRSNIRAIQWGIVLFLLALHAYMKAPVWFLISRLSEVTGGGGWYRSYLIDSAIRHFNEWWLIGTTYTVHWMPTGLAVNPNMADIVNHFIAQGVNGGLLSVILFIWLIVECFKMTGSKIRKEIQMFSPKRFMIWCLGCTVLGHVASFFSVSYFDQIVIFWYLIIGLIAALGHDRNGRIYDSEPQKSEVVIQFSP